jgi:Uma2 family endonuclease
MILAAALHAFAQRGRLGRTLINTAFVLARDPDTVRVPDLAFVSHARLPRGGLSDSILHDAPDLAIEVLSPSNRAGEVRAKVADYLAANGRAVWVVDPRRRTVAVHVPAQGPRKLTEEDELEGGEVLPGFRLPVCDLFAM